MNWNNADEQLPEDTKLKLVYYSWDGKPHGYQLSRFYIPSNMTTHKWCCEFGSAPTKVTHWVNVPSAPK